MEIDKFFNNDPEYMKQLIGRTVSLETVDNKVHTGIIYVIDPIYKNVVLGRKDPCLNVEIIMYHAIKSLTVSATDPVHNEYLLKTTKASDEGTNKAVTGTTLQQKLKLEKWLKHMFINVCGDDGDVLKVEDHLIIMPPYQLDNCFCDNTIVLERIRNIIQLMPDNFQ